MQLVDNLRSRCYSLQAFKYKETFYFYSYFFFISGPIQGGMTSVHLAAKHGNIDVLKALLLQGVEVDDRDVVSHENK